MIDFSIEVVDLDQNVVNEYTLTADDSSVLNSGGVEGSDSYRSLSILDNDDNLIYGYSTFSVINGLGDFSFRRIQDYNCDFPIYGDVIESDDIYHPANAIDTITHFGLISNYSCREEDDLGLFQYEFNELCQSLTNTAISIAIQKNHELDLYGLDSLEEKFNYCKNAIVEKQRLSSLTGKKRCFMLVEDPPFHFDLFNSYRSPFQEGNVDTIMFSVDQAGNKLTIID